MSRVVELQPVARVAKAARDYLNIVESRVPATVAMEIAAKDELAAALRAYETELSAAVIPPMVKEWLDYMEFIAVPRLGYEGMKLAIDHARQEITDLKNDITEIMEQRP